MQPFRQQRVSNLAQFAATGYDTDSGTDWDSLSTARTDASTLNSSCATSDSDDDGDGDSDLDDFVAPDHDGRSEPSRSRATERSAARRSVNRAGPWRACWAPAVCDGPYINPESLFMSLCPAREAITFPNGQGSSRQRFMEVLNGANVCNLAPGIDGFLVSEAEWPTERAPARRQPPQMMMLRADAAAQAAATAAAAAAAETAVAPTPPRPAVKASGTPPPSTAPPTKVAPAVSAAAAAVAAAAKPPPTTKKPAPGKAAAAAPESAAAAAAPDAAKSRAAAVDAAAAAAAQPSSKPRLRTDPVTGMRSFAADHYAALDAFIVGRSASEPADQLAVSALSSVFEFGDEDVVLWLNLLAPTM